LFLPTPGLPATAGKPGARHHLKKRVLHKPSFFVFIA